MFSNLDTHFKTSIWILFRECSLVPITEFSFLINKSRSYQVKVKLEIHDFQEFVDGQEASIVTTSK